MEPDACPLEHVRELVVDHERCEVPSGLVSYLKCLDCGLVVRAPVETD